MTKPSKTALVVVTDSSTLTSKAQLAAFRKSTIAALRFLDEQDRLSTMRKVLIGFALHAIKASVKHGEFMPWLKANVNGKGYAQCNFYMRAATVCAQEMRLEAHDLKGLPGTKINTLKLDVRGGDTLQAKVAQFCGDLTFNELLDQHGIKEIKKLGGPRTAGADEPPAEIDPEVLAAHTREELGAFIATGRQLLLEENVCQRLPAEEVRAFDAGIAALLQDWRQAHATILKK